MSRRVVCFAVLLALAGCGRSAAGVGQIASLRLGPEVERVKAAAVSGDQATAAASLAQLRASVADLRQRDELGEAGAARILAAADEVEGQLGTITSAPVSTVAPPAPAVTETPAPQTPGNGEGDDKGRGKGKGNR